MSDPFDTGIRMTVVSDPTRTRCDVDEFVLCPSNTRADEAITARDEWKRQAEAEARDHLATAKRLVEVEVEVASLSAALGRANHLAWEARQERDAARDRAETPTQYLLHYRAPDGDALWPWYTRAFSDAEARANFASYNYDGELTLVSVEVEG